MANEPDTTPIRSLYAQRFAVDLETNRKEQEAASARIAELDARLQQLKADESWLCGMQGALPPGSEGAACAAAAGAGGPHPAPPGRTPPEGTAAGAAAAGAASAAADGAGGHLPAQPVRTPAIVTAALSAATVGAPAKEAVPRPRRARKATGGATVAKKAARPKKAPAAAAAPTVPAVPAVPAASTTAAAPAKAAKAAVRKPAAAAGKADPATATTAAAPAPATTTEPPLRELVLALLVGAAEPRMVSEVTSAMAEAHPGRPASTQVVRNTLETLARKGAVEKENKQGSVMYTAPRPAPNESAADAAAASATVEGKAAARS
ncbi:hypothetical protein [Streptomyces sp. NPDC058612]|uniref:hypothetical protein n=1 Tax=Streptomyces sp. NPDC058612 TaxID=3346555 RepID=UPI00365191B7